MGASEAREAELLAARVVVRVEETLVAEVAAAVMVAAAAMVVMVATAAVATLAASAAMMAALVALAAVLAVLVATVGLVAAMAVVSSHRCNAVVGSLCCARGRRRVVGHPRSRTYTPGLRHTRRLHTFDLGAAAAFFEQCGYCD